MVDEFINEEDWEQDFSVQEIMDETRLSRNGVKSLIHRKGYKPVRKEGKTHYYSVEVMVDIEARRKYNKPGKSETSGTSKTSQELEEFITHFTEEINLLKSQMLQMAKEISRLRNQKSP